MTVSASGHSPSPRASASRLPWLVAAGLIAAFGCAAPASAQGVVKGAQEGAAAGNRAAGPVGGAVGGAVGGVAGGVAGGVKGVLGIPQNTSTRHTKSSRAHTSTAALLVPDALRTALVGHPVQWRTGDRKQTATATFNEDGTAHLADANIPGMAEDDGRWEIKDNTFCTTWNKVALAYAQAGQESCATWRRTSSKTYRSSRGEVVTLP
jgi:hypothetical protein